MRRPGGTTPPTVTDGSNLQILEIGADHDDENAVNRVTEAAFRTVPKDQTAFMVWRVTDVGTELLPRTHYGTLYDTEAYLIYSCSIVGQLAGPDVIRRELKDSNGELAERHIHSWGGERSSGLAALSLKRATQLAGHVAAPSVLYREMPGHESPRLLAYFQNGVKLLRASNGVSEAGSVKLYQVRGRRGVVAQRPSAGWAHLAADGVFLLDTPHALLLWLGRAANLLEKLLGAKVAYRMARGVEKGMSARRIVIAHDGYEQTLPPAERSLLLALQPPRRAPPAPASLPATTDPARLYRVTTSTRATVPHRVAARLEEVKRAPLFQEDLDDNIVWVIDAGSRGVWARVPAGVATQPNVLRAALAAARGLARARRYSCSVTCVSGGREPPQFAALFSQWAWRGSARPAPLHAASLAADPALAAQAQVPDDGSGALRMWRVQSDGSSLVETERPQAAIFFDKDCYIVLYTYHAANGDHSILYYWMGGSSPNDLRNLGAKEAKDLYTKLGRLPVQAWIYQGKEPPHFLQIFKGRMVTYIGSATDYDVRGRGGVTPARCLVRVSGRCASEARGIELRTDKHSAADSGGSCYVVRVGGRVWVWCARGASGDEREAAKNVAAHEHALVVQGQEKDDFWAAVGDFRHLLVSASPRIPARPLPPRLFYVSLGMPGHYAYEEIIGVVQSELAPEMAAVLDTGGALLLWFGRHCASIDPRHLADHYLAHDPSLRSPETPVLAINQGREPPHFTGFFPQWKHSMWKGHKTFSAIVSALEGKAIVQNGKSAAQTGDSENHFDQYEKYPLLVLRGPREHLPNDVDPLSKELYLTHDDFVSTFNITYNNFRALPTWKQKDLKKAVGLF